MITPTQVQDPHQSELQKQGIEEAKSAYSRLPLGDALFRQCVDGKETLAEVLVRVEQKSQSHQNRKSIKFPKKLHKYTTWLRNISTIVDVAVQTQAGIGCPLWAPIKFVLKISNDHSKAIKRILDLLETIKECLPRPEIYKKLQSHTILQVALLNVFTDVVDFAVRAFQFFGRGIIVRLAKTVVCSFDQEIGAVITQLERHARVADQTAVATELFQAAEFREAAKQRQPILESSVASLDLRAQSFTSRPSSNGPSTVAARMINLLKGHNSLAITRQIELALRLQPSLRKTRVLVDPLKVLFQQILRKASSVRVYMLVAIGKFYVWFGKFQEALEVYTVASKKIDHLEIPLKYTIYYSMGYCHYELNQEMEAVRFYEKAVSGREILLGKRNDATIRSLKATIRLYISLRQYTELSSRCDEFFMGQGFAPDLDIMTNMEIQRYRVIAYRQTGDRDKLVRMKKCLRATLKLYDESNSKNKEQPLYSLEGVGHAYYNLDEYDTALKFYHLALETYKEIDSLKMILKTQYHIARVYNDLSRYSEAKKLLEVTLAEQQRVLLPHHRDIQCTETFLAKIPSNDDSNSENWSQDSWDSFSISSKPGPFNPKDEFDYLDTSQLRHLAALEKFPTRY